MRVIETKNALHHSAGLHRQVSNLMREWMTCRAAEADRTIGNALLRELVRKFTDMQRRLREQAIELTRKQARLEDDLRAAAGIQKSLLPQQPPDQDAVSLAWHFTPSETIGGDIFHVFPLNSSHIGMYMLDVSGHGVPAALVTVSVSQFFQPFSGHALRRNKTCEAETPVVTPVEVIRALDREYPVERFDKFITIIYLVLDLKSGKLSYCNAGHVPALLLRTDGAIQRLDVGGPLIGLDGALPFDEGDVALSVGDRLLLYTDGITEYRNHAEEQYGIDRLQYSMKKHAEKPLEEWLKQLFQDLMVFGKRRPVQDDVSLLGLEWLG
ncbi:MAG: PP2C family protein-serine/threonine phosphatase [Thermodesulfobacteriota bacterium]